MPRPVLVIHGVANRDREEFKNVVAKLQGSLQSGRWELLPVFWGDLGAVKAGIGDTIPGIPSIDVRGEEGLSDAEVVTTILGDAATNGETDVPDRADVISDAATQTDGEVRGSSDVDDDIRDAIQEELPNTDYLKLVASAAVLRAVGASVGASVRRVTEGIPDAETRGPLADVRELTKQILHEADRIVGSVVGEAFGTLNHYLRAILVPKVAEALGDVFVYEHRRQEIQERMWQVIDESPSARGQGTKDKPIHVIAHSLGGVISFHAATSVSNRRLWIDGLVTFGSQSPLFHVLDPTGSSLRPYEPPQPLQLECIGRWTNLWEPLDPLAFIASKVFRVGPPGGPSSSPVDEPTRHLASSGFWTHSTYWTSDELVRAIKSTL